MRRFNYANPEDMAFQMARYRVRKIRNFVMHLLVFSFVILLYTAKTYWGTSLNFWPVRHIGGNFIWIWAFIIAVKGIRLFFREMVFGSSWEQRKMQEFIAKDNQNKWS